MLRHWMPWADADVDTPKGRSRSPSTVEGSVGASGDCRGFYRRKPNCWRDLVAGLVSNSAKSPVSSRLSDSFPIRLVAGLLLIRLGASPLRWAIRRVFRTN